MRAILLAIFMLHSAIYAYSDNIKIDSIHKLKTRDDINQFINLSIDVIKEIIYDSFCNYEDRNEDMKNFSTIMAAIADNKLIIDRIRHRMGSIEPPNCDDAVAGLQTIANSVRAKKRILNFMKLGSWEDE